MPDFPVGQPTDPTRRTLLGALLAAATVGPLAGCGGGGSTATGQQAGLQSPEFVVSPFRSIGIPFGSVVLTATHYPGAQYAAYVDLGFAEDILAPGTIISTAGASPIEATLMVPLPLGAYNPVNFATAGEITVTVSLILNGRQTTRDVIVVMPVPQASPFQPGSMLVLISQLQREMYRRGSIAIASASDRNLLNQGLDQVYGADGIPSSFTLLTDAEIQRMESMLFEALLAIGVLPDRYVLAAGGTPPVQGPTTEAELVPSGTAQGTTSANAIFSPGTTPVVDFFSVGRLVDDIAIDTANVGPRIRKLSSALALAAGTAARGTSSRTAPLTAPASLAFASALLTGLVHGMVYDNVRQIVRLDAAARTSLRQELRFYDEIVLSNVIPTILVAEFYRNPSLRATEARALLDAAEEISDSSVAAPVARKFIAGRESVADLYTTQVS